MIISKNKINQRILLVFLLKQDENYGGRWCYLNSYIDPNTKPPSYNFLRTSDLLQGGPQSIYFFQRIVLGSTDAHHPPAVFNPQPLSHG